MRTGFGAPSSARMMELYHNPASPFVRKVMVTLIETGHRDAVRLNSVTVTPIAPDAGQAAQNPLGKIPTLVRDDGPAIFDSRVICRYLDDRAGGGLYPRGRVWEVLTLEALADGIMEAAVLMVYEHRVRPEDRRHPDWVEAQWLKITRTLDALGARWISHLSGKLHMGQIAVACALDYLDFRHGDRDWRSGRPELAAWSERFGRRTSMQDTMPHAP